MAVTFDAASTDKITVSNPFTLGAGGEFTYYNWSYITATADGRGSTWLNAGATAAIDLFIDAFDPDHSFFINVPRATTGAEVGVLASSDPLTLDTWLFWCVTYKESDADPLVVYRGTLTSVASLASFAYSISGSGDTLTFDGNLIVNNRGASSTSSMAGRFGVVGLFNKKMEAAEIVSHQFFPRSNANCKLLLFPFETATIPDFSGNGKNGTGTGLALGDHVPIGPHFGFDLAPPFFSTASVSSINICWRSLKGVGI